MQLDKADLVAQLIAHLQATVSGARESAQEAAIEAREGATPNEKREDSRVALEQSGLARGQEQRLQRALNDLALLEGFAPPPFAPKARVARGALVEVDSDDSGRTFVLAPAGAGIELHGPNGDGFLSVVTPNSPFGKAIMGCVVGDTVDVTVGRDTREWTVSWVG